LSGCPAVPRSSKRASRTSSGPVTVSFITAQYRGGCEAASPFEVWGIKVESDRLRSGLVRGRGLKPMGIPAELPAMKLITQYLNSYSTVAGSLDPDVHEAFGTHLVSSAPIAMLSS
jgi:hypothetical protein